MMEKDKLPTVRIFRGLNGKYSWHIIKSDTERIVMKDYGRNMVYATAIKSYGIGWSLGCYSRRCMIFEMDKGFDMVAYCLRCFANPIYMSEPQYVNYKQ